jgi:hypothetical protein
MLNEAIGDLLPSALAIALSPIPIVAAVVVLGAPNARMAGPHSRPAGSRASSP